VLWKFDFSVAHYSAQLLQAGQVSVFTLMTFSCIYSDRLQLLRLGLQLAATVFALLFGRPTKSPRGFSKTAEQNKNYSCQQVSMTVESGVYVCCIKEEIEGGLVKGFFGSYCL